MAMTVTTKETIWLQGLLDDLEIDQDFLKMNCDSITAIYLTKNQVYYARTKAHRHQFHFVGRFLMRVTSNYKRFTRKRIPLIYLPRLFWE